MMKKIFAILLALALSLSLAACGKTKGAKITLGQSSRFTREELQAAADCVLARFRKDYDGCTLKRVYYDEAKSIKLAARYIDQPQYGIYGKDPDDIVVLFSDFRTDDTISSFEPNADYDGWSFYLIRGGKGQPWEEYTHGYG
ncbi:MAG: hypothetical protein LBB75_03125 [Oscillospiraceae bacterium]|jgi:ABC-type glycerol-3-phosphate transport system substrate-binding protein|nr:hypothetical protein [Oscillospiraceae bacterium]